jgi:lysylphosphatidylglycerol synthetase-like protein (DUF2156 family)
MAFTPLLLNKKRHLLVSYHRASFLTAIDDQVVCTLMRRFIMSMDPIADILNEDAKGMLIEKTRENRMTQSMKKAIIMVLLITVVVALAIIGFITLPDVLIMQIQANGSAGTTLPKPIGLAIPLLVTVIFSVLYYKRNNNSNRNIGVALLGILMSVLTFVFNR